MFNEFTVHRSLKTTESLKYAWDILICFFFPYRLLMFPVIVRLMICQNNTSHLTGINNNLSDSFLLILFEYEKNKNKLMMIINLNIGISIYLNYNLSHVKCIFGFNREKWRKFH